MRSLQACVAPLALVGLWLEIGHPPGLPIGLKLGHALVCGICVAFAEVLAAISWEMVSLSPNGGVRSLVLFWLIVDTNSIQVELFCNRTLRRGAVSESVAACIYYEFG